MAGSSALGFSAGRCGLILSARAAERAVVQRCPVQGNSPSDRKDYPDFESPQESLHRCPPTRSMTRTVARRECAPASEPQARNLAFFRHRGIFRSDVPCWDLESWGRGATSRWSVPGPATSRRDGRSAPCPSSTMSSGRLFLDQVGRHQRLSPLHRQQHNNTHLPEHPGKGDISTLPARGHFYFALTFSTSLLDLILGERYIRISPNDATLK